MVLGTMAEGNSSSFKGNESSLKMISVVDAQLCEYIQAIDFLFFYLSLVSLVLGLFPGGIFTCIVYLTS